MVALYRNVASKASRGVQQRLGCWAFSLPFKGGLLSLHPYVLGDHSLWDHLLQYDLLQYDLLQYDLLQYSGCPAWIASVERAVM